MARKLGRRASSGEPAAPLVTLDRPSAAPEGTPRLGELLVEQGLVTLADVERAVLDGSRRIGEMLVDAGLVDPAAISAAVGRQYGVPAVDLRQETPEPAAIALLDERTARLLPAVPLALLEGGGTEIAVIDPTPAMEALLVEATGGPVTMVVAAEADVWRVVDSSYRVVTKVAEQVEAFQESDSRRRLTSADAASAEAGDDVPVVRVVDMLILQALRDRASDIHLEPQDGYVQVRNRIDGALHEVLRLPAEMGPALVSRLKIMAGMNIVERRRPQDGQLTMTADGRSLDIRVATVGTIWGEKVVMRLLDKSRPLVALSDLGMPDDTAATYSRLIRSPFGMVLCAGPTGSGKTTTLYASLNEIQGPERNVTTVEDPVEYVFGGINQIQINEQAGVTFANGLKAILRQDPDIILVGEIRDAETGRIAVQSALTGHFVLSSLHATDAVSALYRFLDMGIESFLVASSVLAVVGQRLVRRICASCIQPYTPTADELAFLASISPAGVPQKKDFRAGAGCNFCSQTGYSERIGVYELLRVTDEVRTLLVSGSPSHDDMRRLAVEQGMRPMREEAARLVHENVTTVAEVARSVYVM